MNTETTKDHHENNAKNKALSFLSTEQLLMPENLALLKILETWQCDDDLIAAGILYPAVLQHPLLLEKAHKNFDKQILKLIKGAMQMEVIHHIKRDQAEALRKMMLAMVDDIRVVILKLAERLLLMSDLEKKSSAQQQKIAQETMDYYAPLANRLGLGDLKWQLEDGAFFYLQREAYQKIASTFQKHKDERERNIQEMIGILQALMQQQGLVHYAFSGRVKHLYSIYKKTMRKGIGVENIYDTSAIRVIVPSVADCYTVLSLVHDRWRSIPEEFDDYIAHPKPNGYQSIHTAVLRKDNTPIEIQIRTEAMHEINEQGVAAHWKYKENKAVQDKESEKIILLRELLDWQSGLSKTHDKEKLYRDAFHDRVYVFSPEGEVFDLPQGATPLDFAYLVHTDIGHRTRGAKINNHLVPLTTPLKTGDHIDILTHKIAHPSHDWIRPEHGFLKTINAIRKVKAFYRKLDFEKNLAEGIALWEKIARQHHFELHDIEKLLDGFNLQKTDTLLAALGAGDIAAAAIIQRLTADKKTVDDIILSTERAIPAQKNTSFSVQGAKNLLTQLAQCCHPIPGDDIIGYITKNRGISIHQKKCRNIKSVQVEKPERLIEIDWKGTKEKSYLVHLDIASEDRPGLLRDITGLLSQLNLSIASVQLQTNQKNNMAYIALTIDVANLSLLSEIQQKIKQISGVVTVIRK